MGSQVPGVGGVSHDEVQPQGLTPVQSPSAGQSVVFQHPPSVGVGSHAPVFATKSSLVPWHEVPLGHATS
jgi:hypothetical protein